MGDGILGHATGHVSGVGVAWRGGGVISLEKGTDCGPTAVELWLSRANIAKKEGLCSHYESAKEAVKLLYIRILHRITDVCIQSCL